MLRMSRLLVRTLRDDPSDAEAPSHRLLTRAGYVRRVAPGGYTWLPLGKLVLDQVTRVVREELSVLGAQEVSFPALLPQEPYARSGRLAEYGPDVFRVTDRRGGGYLLAPTHEELFALLVHDLCGSYRDFPLILFQVQTKYRDEPRPRGGPLRGREFLMKDSYSFDLSDEGLATSYAAHREAYRRIFDRLGLRYAVAASVSGPMGGSVSEEFLAETPAGEDTYVTCPACAFAANVEALVTVPAAPTAGDHPPLVVLDTPDTPTIDALVDRLNVTGAGGRTDWRAADTLKNVVLTVDGAPLVIGVPGDREVDLKLVEAALYPARVALFDDWASRPDLVRGYLGPQGLRADRYLVDPRVVPGTAWVTGANEPGRHAVNVVCGRDFVPDGTIEAAMVRAGDPCPRCGQALAVRRGVEIGQIFQLGYRYSDVFGLTVLGPDGTPIRIAMGSYGIGLTRAVATIVEQHHDERGLIWPAEIAPAQVHVVPLRGPAAGLDLAARLAMTGTRVLVDDRPGLSAGVRLTDAELLGMPHVVVLGRRFDEGYVEWRDRATGERSDVALADLPARLANGEGVAPVAGG